MKKHPFKEGDVVKHLKDKHRTRGIVERYDDTDKTVRVKWKVSGGQWEYAKDIKLLERLPITITTSYV